MAFFHECIAYIVSKLKNQAHNRQDQARVRLEVAALRCGSYSANAS
jgi:hypothetical protein